MRLEITFDRESWVDDENGETEWYGPLGRSSEQATVIGKPFWFIRWNLPGCLDHGEWYAQPDIAGVAAQIEEDWPDLRGSVVWIESSCGWDSYDSWEEAEETLRIHLGKGDADAD